MNCVRSLLCGLLMAGAIPALGQVSYWEQEPNNVFPAANLPGNPALLSGDSLNGSITSGDMDLQYLRIKGAGAPGIYRYDFNLNVKNITSGSGDSLLTLFDTRAVPRALGFNDDFPGNGGASRVFFDHFDTSGADSVFGVGIEGYDLDQAFDYSLVMTRTLTPVKDLGSLVFSRGVAGTAEAGRGSWFSFDLASAGMISLDTFGSALADTELKLMGSNGDMLAFNDNADPANPLSQVTANLGAGTYYVVVGSAPSFYDGPNDWDRHGFSGGGDAGRFVLHLQNLSANPSVPEPGALCMLIAGSVPCLCMMLRRSGRKNAQ